MEQIDILSLSPEALRAYLEAWGEPKFRAKQIFGWLHQKQVTEFSQMTSLSLQLREKLEQNFCINRLNIERRLASSIDDTVKYLYRLPDGNFVETVLMDYHHGKSLCISTQVGCRIDSLVLMGIGEPLDNFENVVAFFRLLSHPDGFGMSLRHVAVSTCGLVPRIRELADMRLGVTLSVSLHSPDARRRSEIMPVNRKYPLPELLEACRYYFQTTGRRVTMEYAVIDGVNGTKADAKKLADCLRGMQCHVNLIPVNPIAERSFRAFRKNVEQFEQELRRLGVNATIRRTLGSDIQAACGQLRRDASQQIADACGGGSN